MPRRRDRDRAGLRRPVGLEKGVLRLPAGPEDGPMKTPTLRPRRNTGQELGTEFSPVAEVARNEAPRATIDPDRSLSWLRRALPVMRAHKGIFLTSLALSFVGLVLQVQIPNL